MFKAKDVEEIKTRVLCSITFFLVENHAVYKIMWKSMLKPDRPKMRIARWTTKASLQTLTHNI